MITFFCKKIGRALVSILLLFVCAIPTFAQQNAAPAMADTMRADGKIYVVVLVLATIFAGIILYLISLDRKISRLEKSEKSI